MSDKKNIDRLFQEKFKDFEVEPNEQIWKNIDAALREKKKRKVIPFWFKLSGIAAGFILGFFALNFLFTDSTSVENNPVVIENKKQPKDNFSTESPNQESVVNNEKSSEINNNSDRPSSINQKTNSSINSETETDKAVVNQSQKTKNQKINASIISEKNNAVASTSVKVEKKSTKKKTVRSFNSIASKNQDENLVNNEAKASKDKKNAVNTNSGNIFSVSKSEGTNAVAVEQKNNLNNNNLPTQNKLNNSIAKNQQSTAEQNNIKKDNFLTDKTTDKIDSTKKDTTAIAVAVPNALEELLKKNEEEKNTIAEAKMNRWQITSNVAPIYFSSTSNGSPIDGQFAENSKSYENNLSFGLGVNYAVNKKLSVRTGVNKFTLGYSTNDVVFFAAMDQLSFGSVSSSAAGSTIQVVSENNSEALRPFDNGIQNTNEGIMTQRMGYYEVPLEMSYKLIDKKFGVNVIGGLSTLFLNENEVSVSSSTMSASLGKAKNLNDVHFSTNVGVGFKYRFWKSFEANFEPMFKYQINTFNKDAGNFKPYFIGLYSGVSFNF